MTVSTEGLRKLCTLYFKAACIISPVNNIVHIVT